MTHLRAPQDLKHQVDAILAWLERRGSKRNREGMARYGIVAPKVFGVSVGELRNHARKLGHSHELTMALWKTGWYEARMLAAFVGEPERLTPAQMDRWCRDFDNWAICDTLCFHLFDRTPHAYAKVAAVGEATRGIREAGRLRACRQPRASRRGRAGSLVRQNAAAHRARGHGRQELRQEGSELGTAGDWHEEPGAARLVCQARAAPGRLGRSLSALDRKGCDSGSHAADGRETRKGKE